MDYSEMEQLVQLTDIAGKTIQDVEHRRFPTAWASHERIIISFTDNCFIVLQSRSSENPLVSEVFVLQAPFETKELIV